MESKPTQNNSQPFHTIPGPKQWPLLGNTLAFMQKNPLEWLGELSEEYGRLVRFKAFNKEVVLVSDPEWLRYILQTNYKNFSKEGRAIEKGKVVLGNGLFTSEGEFWRKQRKLAQPAFYKQKLANIAEIMIDCITNMLAEWEVYADNKQVFDLSEEMTKLTLNVVTQSMFSASLSAEEFTTIQEVFPAILRETNRRIVSPSGFLHWLPQKESRSYHKNIKQLDDILFRIIETRKQSNEEYQDLLGLLMTATFEASEEGMSEKQLRDEIVTMFIAGHETTAQALSWTFYLLYKHSDVQTTMLEEVQQVLGGNRATAADFAQLPYTLKVFKETLRMYPPVAFYLRSTIQPFDWGDYHIPANTKFVIPPYLMHYDEQYWDNPQQFDPERFTKEAEKSRPKFVYFPFGGGPRICIGNNFAMMEAVFAIAMISQKFQIALAPPQAIAVDFTLTLRPKGGIPIQIQAR